MLLAIGIAAGTIVMLVAVRVLDRFLFGDPTVSESDYENAWY